jgi:hypothetical protein
MLLARPLPPGENLPAVDEAPPLNPPAVLLPLTGTTNPEEEADPRDRAPGTELDPLGAKELLPRAPGDDPLPEGLAAALVGDITPPEAPPALENRLLLPLPFVFVPTGGLANRLPPLVLLAGRAGVGVVTSFPFPVPEEEPFSPGFWNRLLGWNPLAGEELEPPAEEEEGEASSVLVGEMTFDVLLLGWNPPAAGRLLLANGVIAGVNVLDVPVKLNLDPFLEELLLAPEPNRLGATTPPILFGFSLLTSSCRSSSCCSSLLLPRSVVVVISSSSSS